MITKKFLLNALRVAISVGFIVLLFWIFRGKLGDVVATIKKVDRLLLLASFFCLAGGILLSGIRLRSIMGAQNLRLTIGEVTYLAFIGCFFNNFLPTSMGGDVVKAYYAAKKTGRKFASIACILLDRILGTFTLVIMLLVTAVFVKGAFLNRTVAIFLLIAIGVSFVVIAILYSRKTARKVSATIPLLKFFKLEEKTKSVYDVIHNYREHPMLLIRALLLSVVLQIMSFYSVVLMTRGLGFSVSPVTVFLYMPIVCTMSMAPSINGLGVREGAFVVLFKHLIGQNGALALAILYFGLNFAASLVGGLMYLFTNHNKMSIKEAEEKYDR